MHTELKAIKKCADLSEQHCKQPLFAQTNIGPIVLSMNPYRDVGNPLTLASTRGCQRSPELTKVVQEVIRLQGESGYPQVKKKL